MVHTKASIEHDIAGYLQILAVEGREPSAHEGRELQASLDAACASSYALAADYLARAADGTGLRHIAAAGGAPTPTLATLCCALDVLRRRPVDDAA